MTLLLLSGEGPTDLGACNVETPRICDPDKWRPGPLALLMDQLFEAHMGYSAIDAQCIYFLHRSNLSRLAKKLNHPALRGTGMNLEHRRGTQALASAALALSRCHNNSPVIALYFRDCGGSHSGTQPSWDDLYASMTGEKSGFSMLGVPGVAMLPKPISEAWLICALKSNPYAHCDDLENRSPSDKADYPLKEEYADCLAVHGKSIDDLIRPSGQGELPVVDARRIRMKSFSVFEA
ncbi:hypothetical protein LJC47_05705, partial [Desulfosarcina sp. OttesenSCG-928-B08]|nr:hypothetical protein [Desulfosarcina sp. OttesenSCG-928-B08]